MNSSVLQSPPRGSVLLIRLLVGWVFISEGVQKFIFPAADGVGRFAKIGIPHPAGMAPLVAIVEILCGTLIVIGLLVRLASIPLIIDMAVAITSTKVPILLGHGFWGFSDPTVRPLGIWGMLHEARTDFSMVLGLLFLLMVGAGGLSLDAFRQRRLAGS
jgi:putative oxidoreductase